MKYQHATREMKERAYMLKHEYGLTLPRICERMGYSKNAIRRWIREIEKEKGEE